MFLSQGDFEFVSILRKLAFFMYGVTIEINFQNYMAIN
jgi:hypothetical protein